MIIKDLLDEAEEGYIRYCASNAYHTPSMYNLESIYDILDVISGNIFSYGFPMFAYQGDYNPFIIKFRDMQVGDNIRFVFDQYGYTTDYSPALPVLSMTINGEEILLPAKIPQIELYKPSAYVDYQVTQNINNIEIPLFVRDDVYSNGNDILDGAYNKFYALPGRKSTPGIEYIDVKRAELNIGKGTPTGGVRLYEAIGFKIETFLEGSLFNKITLYEDIKNNKFFSINRDGELISEYFTGNEFLDDDIINGSNHIYEVFLCSETEEKSLGKIKHKAKLSDRKESEKDISLIISEREALTKKILDSEELKKINKNIIGFYKNQYHFLNLLVNLDKYCRMIKNSENVISKLKEVKDMKKNKPKNNFLEIKKTENIEYDMIIKDEKIPLQISEIITNSKKGVV